MKYVVKVSYVRFEFADGLKALNFAQIARDTYRGDDKRIEIDFLDDDEKEN